VLASDTPALIRLARRTAARPCSRTTSGGADGADGGNGGNAEVTLNGNIFKATTSTLTVSGTATGGKGGTGGTGATPGNDGNGGNATVTMNGNILQVSTTLSSMTLNATAVGGAGFSTGNAAATLNGNILQYSGSSAANAFLTATATESGVDSPLNDGDPAHGSKTAKINGNIVQGNFKNVTVSADALYSNGTATVTGNIVNVGPTNTGFVTLEATGQHIGIEQNKITLGKQELDLTINELGSAYDAKIKGNEFTGTGTNTFKFTDNANPGPSPTPDTIAIDLTAGTFVFNGDSNKLKNFANVTVAGDNANFALNGDNNDNVLTGGNGNDTINGNGGNDTLNGNGGNDTLNGGAGNDKLNGGAGNDILDGGAGDDIMDGGADIDTATYIDATSGVTVSLALTTQQDTIGAGKDTLTNIENLTGSNFNDTLTGNAGDNVIMGLAGDDILIATAGTDTLDGGTNTAVGDTAHFRNATAGVTVSIIAAQQDLTTKGLGKVTLVGIENLTGSAFADQLKGDAGNNVLTGGAGNDILIATAGTDTLDGGIGTDNADFLNATSGVTVSIVPGQQDLTASGLGLTTLVSIESLTGSAFNYTLTGDSGNNTLNGGNGNDILFGGAGNDVLNGGANTDVAFFTGRETQYTVTGVLPGAVTVAAIAGPNGGPDGTDTLTQIERIKFLSPSHVSDIDNNGFGDLVFQNGAGNIQIRQQAPNSTLAINGVGATWKAIGTGQFTADTDRNAGILLQDSGTGNLEVITGISGPSPTTVSLTAALTLPVGVTTTGFTAITAGDFNGDAASDVLLQDNASSDVKILFLNTNAGEPIGQVDSAATVTGPGANFKAVSSGDFNGDGKSDILFQNLATGATEVYLMNGGIVTTAGAPILPAATALAVGSGDFNNDGKSDIMFRDVVSNAATIWTMNGTVQTGSFSIASPGAGYVLRGAEDVNNDGFSDLLFSDAANNVKAVELTTGGAILSTVNLGSPAAAFHLVASTGGG
jgi:Ca2+-binding RTX toxin-like protein